MGVALTFYCLRLYILGSFSAPVSKSPVARKQGAGERNGVKFLESWAVELCVWATFDLLVSNVILGSFGTLDR